MNEVGVVRIATARPIFFDPYATNRGTGSFILIDRADQRDGGGRDDSRRRSKRGRRTPRNVWLGWCAQLVPAGPQLSLPAEDDAAMEILRKRLEGVWK